MHHALHVLGAPGSEEGVSAHSIMTMVITINDLSHARPEILI